MLQEPDAEVVIDIKGPGQVVGEVVMEETPPPCSTSARAKGEVVALKLTQENYIRALTAMYLEAESGARAQACSGGSGVSYAASGSGTHHTATAAAGIRRSPLRGMSTYVSHDGGDDVTDGSNSTQVLEEAGTDGSKLVVTSVTACVISAQGSSGDGSV